MKTQGGFTLIELLVVIAILAVLFGVTALALNGVGDGALAATKDAEKDVVQTAIDVCIAQTGCAAVVIQSSLVKVGPATGGPGGFGTYLRRTSKYTYAWTARGGISGQG